MMKTQLFLHYIFKGISADHLVTSEAKVYSRNNIWRHVLYINIISTKKFVEYQI